MPIRRRKRSTQKRPWVTLADFKLAVALPILWLLALAVREGSWRILCYRIEAVRARLGLINRPHEERTLAGVLGRSSIDAREFAIEAAAGCTEHHLQVLRSRSPGGWSARPRLEGAEHLDAALEAGRGAVLWVAHFCFHALAAKKALRLAGYPVWHLSRPEHGFSRSALGIALFNGIRVEAEGEHLAGRIVFERARPGAAALAAQRVLKRNGIVSITAGDWEGQRIAEIDFFGGRLELAVGAPGLARLTGASLLPVFTVRGADEDIIRVVIEPALSCVGTSDQALDAAAQRFGALLERYVLKCPAEWRDWEKLKVPAEQSP